MKRVLLATFVALCATVAYAQQSLVPNFSTLTGNVKVEPVTNTGTRDLPYLTWGADVAAFEANGGINTIPDSIFAKQGLKFRLVNGDDFVLQVKNYMSGKTPYLRGTFTQIASASELLNRDPATKPVMVVQYSWSAGDHLVSREGIKTLNELVGKTICLQQGGPHIGMLDDVLRAGSLKWTDIKVKWAKNLTGTDSPAEMMRSDASIDAAFVISPDMIGLTGGLDQKGTGAEGTIKGAHVLLSTATMNRSIADVMCVRSDFYKDKNGYAEVQKYVAGYLASTERLMNQKKAYNDGKGKSPEYIKALKMAQQILGDKVLPTIEVDAHGLVCDALFVGLPGQPVFFNDPGNVNGFESKQKINLDLAVMLGYASTRAGIEKANWEYPKIATIAGIEYKAPVKDTNRIQGEGTDLFPDSELDERTIASFTINFEPEQTEFNIDTYSAEFRKVIEQTQTFRNAQVVVRGHADPTKTLTDFLKFGMSNGTITRDGKSGSYRYYLKGKPLDLTSTPSIVSMVTNGDFMVGDNDSRTAQASNPQETMQAALGLSQKRAEAVKLAIKAFAEREKLNIDLSQVKPSGVGIREPLIAKPTNLDEAKRNMRVEFRLVRVNSENIKPSDFDY